MRLLRHGFLLFLMLAAAACGRKGDLEHRVRNYDVVEEGSASGVTTSLGGEQPGTVPALTATNVDTTTDLSLLPGLGDTTVTGTTAPGSLADTLDADPAASPRRGAPPAGAYRPSSPSTTGRESAPARPADTTPSRPTEPSTEPPTRETPAQPAPEPEPAPPVEENAPPTTTTPATTSTQPADPPPTNTAPGETPVMRLL